MLRILPVAGGDLRLVGAAEPIEDLARIFKREASAMAKRRGEV
jgi:hypothetical protein